MLAPIRTIEALARAVALQDEVTRIAMIERTARKVVSAHYREEREYRAFYDLGGEAG